MILETDERETMAYRTRCRECDGTIAEAARVLYTENVGALCSECECDALRRAVDRPRRIVIRHSIVVIETARPAAYTARRRSARHA